MSASISIASLVVQTPVSGLGNGAIPSLSLLSFHAITRMEYRIDLRELGEDARRSLMKVTRQREGIERVCWQVFCSIFPLFHRLIGKKETDKLKAKEYVALLDSFQKVYRKKKIGFTAFSYLVKEKMLKSSRSSRLSSFFGRSSKSKEAIPYFICISTVLNLFSGLLADVRRVGVDECQLAQIRLCRTGFLRLIELIEVNDTKRVTLTARSGLARFPV